MPKWNPSHVSAPPATSWYTHQEIVDILALGVLRLLEQGQTPTPDDAEKLGLGFCPPQSVTTNPDNENGVQP